jgi:hypothetical protein
MPETSNLRSSAWEAAAAVEETIRASNPVFSIDSTTAASSNKEALYETSADSLSNATLADNTPGKALQVEGEKQVEKKIKRGEGRLELQHKEMSKQRR